MGIFDLSSMMLYEKVRSQVPPRQTHATLHCSQKVETLSCPKNVYLYAEVFTIPFTGTKGSNPTSMFWGGVPILLATQSNPWGSSVQTRNGRVSRSDAFMLPVISPPPFSLIDTFAFCFKIMWCFLVRCHPENTKSKWKAFWNGRDTLALLYFLPLPLCIIFVIQ